MKMFCSIFNAKGWAKVPNVNSAGVGLHTMITLLALRQKGKMELVLHWPIQ